MLLWVDQAPKPGDPETEIINFINKYVTCSIPSPTEDQELYDLVTSVQQHHHTKTCRKKNTVCRFNFPRFPTDKTIIAKPLDKDQDDQVRLKTLRETLAKVYTVLSDKELKCDTIDEVCEKADVDKFIYQQAIGCSSRGTQIVLQRNVKEIHTNNYNPTMLKIWKANMDIQYAYDPYACIAYMVAYITKNEREMGQLLKTISDMGHSNAWYQRMKKVGKAFLNAREVSAQEAVYRLLGFPMFRCSFRTIFIPNDFPNKRIGLLKPQKLLETQQDNDTNIFMPNIIERYENRPSSLSRICLAEFAATYIPVKKPHIDTELENLSEEEDIDDTEEVVHISLSNGLGKMKKSTRAIIRYHKKHVERDGDSYYYSNILLFLPWSSERDLLSIDDYSQFFSEHQVSTSLGSILHNFLCVSNGFQFIFKNQPGTI